MGKSALAQVGDSWLFRANVGHSRLGLIPIPRIQCGSHVDGGRAAGPVRSRCRMEGAEYGR